jgi:hypothetical protein
MAGVNWVRGCIELWLDALGRTARDTVRLKISLILLPARGKRQSAANQAANDRSSFLAVRWRAEYASLDGFKAST